MLTTHSFRAAALVLTVVAASACAAPSTEGDPEAPNDGVALATHEVARDLPQITSVTHAGDGSGRMFVTLQEGKVMVLDSSGLRGEPFLDLSALVACCGERGLLDVAFHPRYPENGQLFVNYTATSGDTVVARYRVSADPNRADPDSAREVLRVPQPFGNHNGGQTKFGPDGFLYVAMGDGGSGGDPQNHGQRLDTLLGALLRIDIDVDGEAPYAVPESNPFAADEAARGEIWAYGLRNPWRFSFDRLTGDLFIADVGQSAREEINLQRADSPGGENYGWRLMEGSLCFNPRSGCQDPALTPPILEYDHSQGCSVTGGYRYRGEAIPELTGVYLYGDFCSGRIWGGSQGEDGLWSSRELLRSGFRIATFGEDEAGELYLADRSSSALYRLVAAPR